MNNQLDGKHGPNLVIGGGVIGLLIAWYLSESGKRVVVIDRGQTGKESSWAGGGILTSVYPNQHPLLESLISGSLPEYENLTIRLTERTGIDCELLFSQLIVLDAGDYGSPVKPSVIDAATLAAMEPALAAPNRYAYCFPTAQIRNPRFLAALRSSLLGRGVEILENNGALKLETHARCLSGASTTQGHFSVDRAVVSAGAWTANLLAQTGLSLPISPVRGQMIVFRAQAGLISNIIVYKHHYLIPRKDGRILVGSTVEPAGFVKETTNVARSELYAAAVELVPELKACPIEHHWAGLRPGSPDEAPFIGEHPGIKGLFVCAGHYRNGFATGPASARLVVDMMLGRPPSVDPTPFRLDRPCPEWNISSPN